MYTVFIIILCLLMVLAAGFALGMVTKDFLNSRKKNRA